ncbi:MAG TPA: hypothetical protein VKW06_06215 [Candidatus Angelobacter sp.]|nr:hypothetical protein [Candidatus Angelobacter sp.]
MNRLALLFAAMLLVAAPLSWGQISPPPGSEQHREHGNMGVFLDYTRFQPQSLNLLGLGGRIGFNVQRHVVLEAEMAYDFSRPVTQNLSSGGANNTITTDVRMWHALFGPKIQTTGKIRYFGFFKAGIVNFGVSGPTPAGGVNNQLGNVLNGNIDKVYYPGGGVEFKIGRVTMRAEAGDELIYYESTPTSFTTSPHGNLRATIGPQIHF